AAPAKRAEDLVPGKDYQEIPITDDMSPEEVRKARIANAKARSAAVKALKAAGAPAGAPAADGEAMAPVAVAEPTAVAEPVAVGGEGIEPVAGRDYQEIPITADMSPEEVRKARIANAKAKSAAAKALRAAGAQAGPAAGAPASRPAPAEAAVAEAPAPQAPAEAAQSSIPRPEYIEITGDMSPDEIRKARIANAKLKSAYAKALKEAGIDPATVAE
ncbi:MAG: hypothetical protein L0322_23040, partial [Chloroflexi bacterium]|nr:hypothetical protein [Chloroflexota bacterium]